MKAAKTACCTGPFGSAIASMIGRGCQGPAASMAVTKPGISPSAAGAAARASATIASPRSRQRVAKSRSPAVRGEAVALDGKAQQGDARVHRDHRERAGSGSGRGIILTPQPSISAIARRGLQAGAGQHHHRRLARRDPAIDQQPGEGGGGLGAGGFDIDAAPGQAERGLGDLRLLQQHRAAAALPQRGDAFRRAQRLGDGGALGDGRPRRLGRQPERGPRDRPAIRRLGGENPRHPVDLPGPQQFRKADLQSEHVRPGAAGHDHVVGQPILPQLIGQGLGAVQEEGVPVVAGVEGLRRRALGRIGAILPAARHQFDGGPDARDCTVFAGEVLAGTMIVARIPPAAA